MNKENTTVLFDISNILKIFAILTALTIGIWVAWELRTVIIAILVSTIIALGLEPAVELFEKKKLSRGISVLIVYVTFIVFIIALGTLAFTPMVNQTVALVNNFPNYVEQISSIPELENFGQQIEQEIGQTISSIGGQAIQTTLNAASTLLLVITIFVLTAYILLDFNNIRKNLHNLIPKPNRDEAIKVTQEIEKKLGYWLRGQAALMLIIGIMSYVGLLILDVKYALSLGLIAGILELVPIIGPIVSVIPALIVAFGDSPIKGLGVIGLYIIIQQLENNLIVPKVMQKAVGFNPLITMIAILIGGQLLGVIGALLAVPVTIICTITIKAIYKHLY